MTENGFLGYRVSNLGPWKKTLTSHEMSILRLILNSAGNWQSQFFYCLRFVIMLLYVHTRYDTSFYRVDYLCFMFRSKTTTTKKPLSKCRICAPVFGSLKILDSAFHQNNANRLGYSFIPCRLSYTRYNYLANVIW